MYKISIVMPLYNAAKYLEESLVSVLNQTLTEFELICINDASTDDTMSILKQFAARDDRIKILINDERSGAAYSRNRGMKAAVGKYLSFLDGDDIFEEEMLDCAYKEAERCSADIVIFEVEHYPSDDIHTKRRVVHSEAFLNRYCDKSFKIQEQLPYEFMNLKLRPDNKLYNREFIVNNNLEFQTLNCSNDVYFVFMALVLSEKSRYLRDNRVMIYARDHDEPSRISYNRDPMCSYLAFLQIAKELKQRNKFVDVYPQYYYQFFFSVRDAFFRCKSEEDKREFYEFLKTEGIDEICSYGKEYYGQLNTYIRDLLEQFKTNTYESQWYREEQGLLIQLSEEVNAAAVRNLFNDCKYKNKAVCIWGVGANGISLLNFCVENELNVDIVVDKSKEKQGKVINGYMINPTESLGDNIKVVIVTARCIVESVRMELSGKEAEIIDINEYLEIY